jgi:hypothetical protein
MSEARPNQRQHTRARRGPTYPARTLRTLRVSADSLLRNRRKRRRTQVLLIEVIRQKNGTEPVYVLVGRRLCANLDWRRRDRGVTLVLLFLSVKHRFGWCLIREEWLSTVCSSAVNIYAMAFL